MGETGENTRGRYIYKGFVFWTHTAQEENRNSHFKMDKDLTITKEATGWQTHEFVLNIISIKGQIKATKRHRYRVFRILKSKRLIILSIGKDMAHSYTAAGNQFGSFSKSKPTSSIHPSHSIPSFYTKDKWC